MKPATIPLSLGVRRQACAVLVLIWTFMLLAAFSRAAFAAPAAGVAIGNQASATYSDGSQAVRTVTSNTVVTVVQQVASLTLTAPGAKNGNPAGQVSYPHTLTNTGNGTDTFSLGATNTGSYSMASVLMYADANGDGVPDNATPILSTGELAAGGVFRFVIVATLPPTAVAGTTNAITVTATSAYTPAVSASNIDTTAASSNAVVNVTKSIDLAAGLPGSGPRTFSLTYVNSGNSAATNLTITDIIPSGMTYVAGSARWSNTGSTVLTDANAADNQSGIVYDFNITSANRLTAVIASVPAGSSGILTFQVNINAGLAPGANAATLNTAAFTYNDGGATVGPSNTNSVQFVVTQVAAVTMTGATTASALQGATVSFPNVVTNTGNGTDSFDITIGTSTFPAGTTFTLFQSDGLTPLVDTNGTGIPDTGPLAAGASYTVVLKAVLPGGATGGPYTVQKIATSKADATKTATAVDTLTAITASTVDLTANSTGVGAPGVGAGPEASAVVSNTVNPGATTRYTLYVTNNSGAADTYNLLASTDVTFAALNLPTGWTVVFKDSTGAVIPNTGVVNAGTSKLVYADVTVPANAAAGTTDLYFRTVSPTSAAADRLHVATVIATSRGITVTPNNNGQVYPGGTVVFTHTIINNGNVLEGDAVASQIALSVVDSVPGFTSVVYWDKNNNGILDAADVIVTNLSQLVGGSGGASTAAGLSPGESATLLVKVNAPPGAPIGVIDTTTLTATTTGTINGVPATAAVSATDSSTVIAGQLQLVTQQALDAACDGAPDTAYSMANITIGAIPGACIRYQVTATNIGVANIVSVVVSNATPALTTYHATVPAAVGQGSVTAPSGGATGTVQASIGTMTPGQVVNLTFGVRINP